MGARYTGTTKDRVRACIQDTLGVTPSELKDDADLTTDLSADTLDLAEVCMALEDEFDLAISDRDWYAEGGDRLKYPTPAAIATYLDGKLKKA